MGSLVMGLCNRQALEVCVGFEFYSRGGYERSVACRSSTTLNLPVLDVSIVQQRVKSKSNFPGRTNET